MNTVYVDHNGYAGPGWHPRFDDQDSAAAQAAFLTFQSDAGLPDRTTPLPEPVRIVRRVRV